MVWSDERHIRTAAGRLRGWSTNQPRPTVVGMIEVEAEQAVGSTQKCIS
jgi:hypothetical protein